MVKSRLTDSQVNRIIHGLMLTCLLGIFIIQIVQVSGGGSASSVMARAEQFLSSYPEGQLERSLKQTVDVVENMHLISARAKFIVDRINPTEMQTLAARFNEKDISNTMELVGNLNGLLKNIQMDDVRQVVVNTRDISASLNGARLNELIDATKMIEQRLKNLHEIKIQI